MGRQVSIAPVAVAKCPNHTAVAHGRKVHKQRRASLSHVARNGERRRFADGHFLGSARRAVGVADLQRDGEITPTHEHVLGMTVGRCHCVAKRPIPAHKRVASVGQAQIGEGRGLSLTHCACGEAGDRGRVDVHGFVDHAHTAIGPSDLQPKQVAPHRGQLNVRHLRASHGAAVGQRPRVRDALADRFIGIDRQHVAALRV